MDRRFERPAVWQDLRRTDMLYVATVLSMQTAGDRTLREFAGTGPLNEERRPRLEYAAPLALFRSDTARGYRTHDDRLEPSRRGELALSLYLASRRRPLKRGEYIDLLSSPRTASDLPALRLYADEWRKILPRDPMAAAAQRAVRETP
jgi:hypothetical protein